MRSARLRAELVLASATAAVGLINIVSALTPGLRGRVDLVELMVPPWAPRIFTVASLAFGLMLVRLAPALARGRQSAWTIAVATAAAVAVADVAKGLDVEEATTSLALLVALVVFRGRFRVPGRPPARPLLETIAALGAVCAALGFFAFRFAVPDAIEDAFAGVALVLGARTLMLWLRPLGAVVRQTAEERASAARLIGAYGSDSLSFFALRRDKSWFFSADDRAFLSYRVVGGVALVSGDPVGAPDAVKALVGSFTTHAHEHGWRVAFLATREELLPLYSSLGLRTFTLGREAVVRPDTFSLEGRRIRKVRQSVHRARRAGYSLRVLDAGTADPALRGSVSALADEARGRWPERGFTMALDDLFAPGTVLAIAQAGDRPDGFLHLVPTEHGYSLSSMRRRRGTVNGLMEYLIAETLLWAGARGANELSLNFCVFADVLAAEAPGLPARAARWALLHLDALFQLERLRSFSAKFGPRWRPRYVLYERLTDAPLVGLAYLRAESLLTPPGPWSRAATS
jgi:lysyl-tRNA synthetase, class II